MLQHEPEKLAQYGINWHLLNVEHNLRYKLGEFWHRPVITFPKGHLCKEDLHMVNNNILNQDQRLLYRNLVMKIVDFGYDEVPYIQAYLFYYYRTLNGSSDRDSTTGCFRNPFIKFAPKTLPPRERDQDEPP